MDSLTALLAEAQAAGLRVQAEGERLVIRGPKRAEPIALKLIEHKAEVLRLMVPEPPCLPALNAKTVVEVLGPSPSAVELRALAREVAEALARLRAEIRSGQLGQTPILVRGRPLGDYLPLEEIARLLVAWTLISPLARPEGWR